MGRPRKGAAKPERPPDERIAIIHLKGSPAYAEWLDAFHEKTHIPKATLFRLAMQQLAAEMKFKKPPEL